MYLHIIIIIIIILISDFRLRYLGAQISVYLAAEKSLALQYINAAMSASRVQKERSPTFPVEFVFVSKLLLDWIEGTSVGNVCVRE